MKIPMTSGSRGLALSEGVLRLYRPLIDCLLSPGRESSPLLRTLGMTSVEPGEGVSTVAAQLAMATAATRSQRVLLVDGNVSDPSVHARFSVSQAPGFAEVLSDACRLPEALRESGAAGLFLLTAGQPGPGLSGDYRAERLSDVLEAIKIDFDLVVFDLPARLRDSDAMPLAALMDGILLVLEAGRVPWDEAVREKDLLLRARMNVVGVVLNKAADVVLPSSER
jgi:capsular exopolysaccharide synthesis family protein